MRKLAISLRLVGSLLMGGALVATAAVEPPAFAKKDKEVEYVKIKKTGIKEFDDIFMQVKDIQDVLQDVEKAINSSSKDLATALGLSADTPFSTAVADLKEKAQGKITVVQSGTVPTLAATDAVPGNVQAGMDAVNHGIAEVANAADGLKSLPNKMTALASSASSIDMTAALNTIKSKTSSLGEATDLLKTLKDNVKGTTQTKDRATDTAAAARG